MKAGLWAQSDHVTTREGKERGLGTGEGVVRLCGHSGHLLVRRYLEGGCQAHIYTCV